MQPASASSSKQVACPVDGCQRTYGNDGSLRNHLRMAHSDRHMLPKANTRTRRASFKATASHGAAAASSLNSRSSGPKEALGTNVLCPSVTATGAAGGLPLLNTMSVPDLWLHQAGHHSPLPAISSPLIARRMHVLDATTPSSGVSSATAGPFFADAPLPWNTRVGSDNININRTAAPEPRSRSFSHNMGINNSAWLDGRQPQLARTSSSPSPQREPRLMSECGPGEWSSNTSPPTMGMAESGPGEWTCSTPPLTIRISQSGREWPSNTSSLTTDSLIESAARRLQALADLSARIAVHADEVMDELRRNGEGVHGSRSPRTCSSPRQCITPRSRSSLSGATPYRRDSLPMRRLTDPNVHAVAPQTPAQQGEHGMLETTQLSTSAYFAGSAGTGFHGDYQMDAMTPGSLSAAPNSSLSSNESSGFHTATTGVQSRDSQRSSASEGRADHNTSHQETTADHQAFLNLAGLWQLLQPDTLDTVAAGDADMTESSYSHEDQAFISNLAAAWRES